MKSTSYKKLGVDAEKMSSPDIAKMLSDQPRAMIRPLLSNGKNLVAGFKPEEMSEII